MALTLAVAGCAAPAEDDRALRAESFARTYSAAFETADSAALRELFWPMATYEDFPNQHTYLGVDEIVGYVTGVHGWADDVYLNVGRVHPTETGLVVEWVFSAVQARPIDGRLGVGTGAEVVLNGVTVFELDGERAMRAADYTDTGALMLQLGGRIELPDGTTLELSDVVN